MCLELSLTRQRRTHFMKANFDLFNSNIKLLQGFIKNSRGGRTRTYIFVFSIDVIPIIIPYYQGQSSMKIFSRFNQLSYTTKAGCRNRTGFYGLESHGTTNIPIPQNTQYKIRTCSNSFVDCRASVTPIELKKSAGEDSNLCDSFIRTI